MLCSFKFLIFRVYPQNFNIDPQGRIIVDEGHLRAMQGLGRFVPLPPFSPHVYEKVRAREAAALELRSMRPVVRSGKNTCYSFLFLRTTAGVRPPVGPLTVSPEDNFNLQRQHCEFLQRHLTRFKNIFSILKNALAYYNARVVAANS
jgi:hypothetical protein